ncbi:MAG: hypothetical protein COS99_05995 [Candidatus Omnitrophica bacterium CG07_land_8_20_14_0_80_42_15]|uniref:Hydrogenase nickel incorporation protein HypA n=1 Tax=Candidatus Aquitaenariimonas noxiae TaxID=1974741 RepID=A0A2J0KSF0_9BACT|nr:MAG: hypothetical protein COS99_05995 [Candidatus Omnitrophica bacterium CG07_land_8_20_14_0_80_42_15]
MIKLDILTAVSLYIFFSVIAILVIWVFFGPKQRKNIKDISEKKHIWHCSICDHTYVDSRHEDISQCPRCNSYIEKDEGGDIEDDN